jgi:GH18 family chitinase
MEIISDWCRENEIEFFWSMRMNDTHDAWSGRDVSELKKRLRDCLLGSNKIKPAHGHWTALDYGQEKVRDLVYRLVEEVCTNYEVDGLELDFWRYPVLFRTVAEGSRAGDAEREAFTDLMRQIRKTADRIALQRGEAILIAVRVPDSVGYCRDMGIDIETWLTRGWDQAPGGDRHEVEWKDLAERYVRK